MTNYANCNSQEFLQKLIRIVTVPKTNNERDGASS